jgi:hypothetical protein
MVMGLVRAPKPPSGSWDEPVMNCSSRARSSSLKLSTAAQNQRTTSSPARHELYCTAALNSARSMLGSPLNSNSSSFSSNMQISSCCRATHRLDIEAID